MIRVGHALDVLKTINENSVQSFVTSSPYYRLREYGTDPIQWSDGSICELGWEDTPGRFVSHLGDIFDECKRVLRPDGTGWIVIGDSYAGGKGGMKGGKGDEHGQKVPASSRDVAIGCDGIKEKDLIGIPWMLAFELRRRGWYLRNLVCWQKPQGLPAPVYDRLVNSHETVIFITKSPRYFFNYNFIREPVAESSRKREKYPWVVKAGTKWGPGGETKAGGLGNTVRDSYKLSPAGRLCRDVWSIPTESLHARHFAPFPQVLAERCILAGTSPVICRDCKAPYLGIVRKEKIPTRPGRDVGTGKSGTEADPQSALHSSDLSRYRYKVFYFPDGFEPTCDCCVRHVEGEDMDILTDISGGNFEQRKYVQQVRNSPYKDEMKREVGLIFDKYLERKETERESLPADRLRTWIERGWLIPVQPNQKHATTGKKCTVLDPFLGSGTTGRVCHELGLDFIGIELNPEYAKLAEERIAGKKMKLPRKRPDNILPLFGDENDENG